MEYEIIGSFGTVRVTNFGQALAEARRVAAAERDPDTRVRIWRTFGGNAEVAAKATAAEWLEAK